MITFVCFAKMRAGWNFVSADRRLAALDVEIADVQLRLEDAAQRERVMAVERTDCIYVAVIMRCGEGRLRAGHERANELQRIGGRMVVRPGLMFEGAEVEGKIV
ncbi:MAG TPA: hypothetical protein VN065_08440, partial [Bradyrhizobium sp.]|nr:hypothetical protein [Bradyrhizobium sp.]